MFRATKVSAIFDFDKTLSPDYMQKVIFDNYNVDEGTFWDDCRIRTKENEALFGTSHHELDYMNTILNYVRDGRFAGLDNTLLAKLGNNIKLYPGVPWMLNELYKLGVEVYIVSAGIKIMLQGLEESIREQTKNPEFKIHGVFAGDFRCNENGVTGLSSIANCMDSIGKTKAIYEISKGCNVYGYDFTVSLPKENGRRVPLEQILYIGDGFSDIPAMNLIYDSGGHTLGVFDPKSKSQFAQIEQIRSGDRLSTVACADYTEGSTAATWLLGKASELLYKSSESYLLRKEIGDLRGNPLKA